MFFFILKLSINEVSKCKQGKVHLLPVTYSLSAELSFKTHFHLNLHVRQTKSLLPVTWQKKRSGFYLSLCFISFLRSAHRRWVGWCVLQNSEPSPLRYSCSLLPHMLVLILVWLLAGVSSPWLPSLGGDWEQEETSKALLLFNSIAINSVTLNNRWGSKKKEDFKNLIRILKPRVQQPSGASLSYCQQCWPSSCKCGRGTEWLVAMSQIPRTPEAPTTRILQGPWRTQSKSHPPQVPCH